MRQMKVLALVNGVAAAAALITLAALAETGLSPTAQMVADAARKTDPAFGLDILSRSVTHWHERAAVYSYMCYCLLFLLALNSFCLAVSLAKDPAR